MKVEILNHTYVHDFLDQFDLVDLINTAANQVHVGDVEHDKIIERLRLLQEENPPTEPYKYGYATLCLLDLRDLLNEALKEFE